MDILAQEVAQNALAILNLLPRSILGVLLLFAGAQLALMVADLKEKKDRPPDLDSKSALSLHLVTYRS